MKLIPTKHRNLKRDPESGIYYWRQFSGGKEFFKSTGEAKNETKAYRIGMRLYAEWLGTPEAMKKASFNFEDIAQKYLAMKQNRRKRTIVSAKAHVEKHLLPFFGGYNINTVPDKWESYVAHKRLEAPDRKFFNDAKHMRSILKLAFELGALERPAKVVSPDAMNYIGKEYTEDEIARLLANANEDLRLQINMAYLMGMRRSEILLLRWSRVDFVGGVLKLRGEDTKTGHPREVPLHKTVSAELLARHRKPHGPFVFPSPIDENKPVQDNKTAWRACREAAGVYGRFHDLRHTAVTRMLFMFHIPAAHVGAIVGMSMTIINRYAHPKGKYLQESMNAIRGISEMSGKKTGATNEED